MAFQGLHLKAPLLKAVQEQGYSEPTSIQKELIPAIFSGRDILAGARTGTGKTAGFALPLLQDIAGKSEEEKHYIRAIVLVPTRELAKQVHESFVTYGKYLPLRSEVLFGGSNFNTQAKRLSEGVDIVIATTGRLLEHLSKRTLDISAVRFLVMDEADTILDMGFLGEVSQILQQLPEKRQNILISATLSSALKRLSRQVLEKPKRIETDSMGTVSDTVTQMVYLVIAEKKTELLSYLIDSQNYTQVLVFVRKKAEADIVAKELKTLGLKSATIHGEKSPGERSKALDSFKERKVRVLVATDIVARGLDIPNLEVVFSYDIPHVTQDFIHRIGRTGRAGKAGLAITLISPSEMPALLEVERMLGKPLPRKRLEEYAPQEELLKQKQEKKSAVRKRRSVPAQKKRKTTKRDGFKTLDASKPKSYKEESRRGKRK